MYAGSAELAAEKCVRLFHSAQQQEKRKSTYNMQSNVRLSEGEAGAFKGQSAELKQKLLQKYIICDKQQTPCRSKNICRGTLLCHRLDCNAHYLFYH